MSSVVHQFITFIVHEGAPKYYPCWWYDLAQYKPQRVKSNKLFVHQPIVLSVAQQFPKTVASSVFSKCYSNRNKFWICWGSFLPVTDWQASWDILVCAKSFFLTGELKFFRVCPKTIVVRYHILYFLSGSNLFMH